MELTGNRTDHCRNERGTRSEGGERETANGGSRWSIDYGNGWGEVEQCRGNDERKREKAAGLGRQDKGLGTKFATAGAEQRNSSDDGSRDVVKCMRLERRKIDETGGRGQGNAGGNRRQVR